jgi:hypothetical protein
MEKDQIDLSVFKLKPYNAFTINELNKYDEFKELKKIDLPTFVNYIILMYDFKSPLREEYPFISIEQNLNYSRKKMEAAKLAGYKTVLGKDGKKTFDKETQAIILMQNTQCNHAIARYISLFGRPEYVKLIVYEEMLINKAKAALDGEEQKDAHKVIDFLSEKIVQISDSLFGGRETIEARQAFYAIAEKQDINIFPEQIAKILKEEGNLPVEMSPFHGKMPDDDIKKMQTWRSDYIGSRKPN